MKIKCNFWSRFEAKYECYISAAKVLQRDPIISLDGDHIEGKSNEDVKDLTFFETTICYLPTGIDDYFPHLHDLYIISCGLKDISSRDLLGFDNLEMLWATDNELRSLPDDLFVNTKKLKTINFDGNQLKSMSSKIFDPIPLEQLEYVTFLRNLNIDAVYRHEFAGSIESMEALKTLIDYNCSPPIHDVVMTRKTKNDFKKLWKLDKYCDFTIIAGALEIPVLRSVLAVQSSVFADMFDNDEEVKSSRKLEIKDSSEEIVEEFVQCLYLGQIYLDSNALDLYNLACTFNVEDLKHAYEELAITQVNKHNAVHALKIANLYKSEKLGEVAWKTINLMLPDTLDDRLKLNPGRIEKILEAFMTYKKLLEED